MEDNSTSDDEIKETNRKMGGKKLKLNDGSSQDSVKETASGSKNKKKEDNVDSGVSADKSESTSSEGRGAGPSNAVSEVVDEGSSSSNFRAIVLKFSNPMRKRNYRKRKTPDRDSDSNFSSTSSQSSDDESADEANLSQQADNTSDADTTSFSERTCSPSSKESSDSSDSTSSDLVRLSSGDIDSDSGPWSNGDIEEEEERPKPPEPPVLAKDRPQHNYIILKEIINREMGLTFPCGKEAKDDVIFEQKFYGSLHVIYRLKKVHQLMKHRGCVNSINFHPEGQLLASGSDDTTVVVWDWAKNTALQTIKTGHKSNVFQSKFLYLNASSQLNIVTCARDGQIRLLQCPPSGGAAVSRRRLASHYRAAHKLHVTAAEPQLVVSAGEDGVVIRCDLRVETSSKLFQVLENGTYLPLYSVAGHPLDTRRLLIAGRNRFVRVYDTRMPKEPAAMYCPAHFAEDSAFATPNDDNKSEPYRSSLPKHLTCAVYNHDGSEILGSYNDDDIYLFDAKDDVYNKDSTEFTEGFRHRYSGHRNSATFKGVTFFGPRSEYVVSGSDCSHVFVWDRRSEAIVQFMQADVSGVVNCIETHPRCPVLATSGLDKDVKIWMPTAQEDPTFRGLEKVVRENAVSPRRPLFSDFLPTLYSAWRGEAAGNDADDFGPDLGGNIEFDGNMCTTF